MTAGSGSSGSPTTGWRSASPFARRMGWSSPAREDLWPSIGARADGRTLTHRIQLEDHDRDGTPPRALRRGQWRSPAVLGSVGFELPGGTPAPSDARHRVLEALGEVLGPEERSNMALMVSELVTNAVRHAG